MIPQTPMGNVSTKLAPGKTFKRYMRIERIARLTMENYTETEIGMFERVTPQYINMLKRTPEYIAIRMSVATGVISNADRNMYESIQNRRTVIEEMVPSALAAIKDAILDRSNPSLRLKASQDLLDREGSLGKVSRTEITVPKEFSYKEHDAVSQDLLAAMQDAVASATSGEVPGIKEFTQTALSKEDKIKLQESLNIITAMENNVNVVEGSGMIQ